MAAKLSIAVYSDVICPWCYIGKRRLEQALEAAGLSDSVDIRWLPFELNPDMPPDGMPRALYRARKFGPERAAALDANIVQVGREDGIRFAFDRVERTPNTRPAHMLIAYASQHDLGPAMKDALLRAYFEEARDIGDTEVLVELAESVGLDRDEATAALSDQALRLAVEENERRAGGLGISGVPFFIINETYGVSGAQPASVWVEALREFASRPTEAAQVG